MTVVYKTKSGIVYDKLKKSIIIGKLKPGEKITISKLSKEFGVSDIPIREALKGLESEGFVTFTPHVGAVVTELEADEVLEIFLIRIELEALAARLAAPYISEDDIRFLEKKLGKMEKAVGRQSYEELGQLNKDFHLRIYRAAPYPILYKFIVDLMAKYQRTQSIFALSPERALASVKEHAKIINALVAKDASLAERLTREQKQVALNTLKNYFKKNDKRSLSSENRSKNLSLCGTVKQGSL